jgi:hypothetical protein
VKPSEAVRVLTKVGEFFPREALSELAKTEWALRLEHLDAGIVNEATDVLIMRMDRHPSLHQILEAAREAEKRTPSPRQEQLVRPALTAHQGERLAEELQPQRWKDNGTIPLDEVARLYGAARRRLATVGCVHREPRECSHWRQHHASQPATSAGDVRQEEEA